MTEQTNILGWREWAGLPDLGITWLKAKVDTGARTSALHAFETERFERDGQTWVRFRVRPKQKDDCTVCCCEAPVVEERVVTDSGGHKEKRPVIRTQLRLGDQQLDVEVTLTNRDSMLFRMLIGRTAIKGNFMVSPGQSFVLGGDRDQPPELM